MIEQEEIKVNKLSKMNFSFWNYYKMRRMIVFNFKAISNKQTLRITIQHEKKINKETITSINCNNHLVAQCHQRKWVWHWILQENSQSKIIKRVIQIIYKLMRLLTCLQHLTKKELTQLFSVFLMMQLDVKKQRKVFN